MEVWNYDRKLKQKVALKEPQPEEYEEDIDQEMAELAKAKSVEAIERLFTETTSMFELEILTESEVFLDHISV